MINFFKNLREIKIIRNSSNYFLGNIATSSIAFFSIPIFTRLLTLSDYGKVNLFTAFFSVATIFSSLGFEAAISNKYLKEKHEFGAFLATNLVFLFFVQLLVLFIFLMTNNYLSVILKVDKEILNLACFSGILMTAYKIYQSYLKSSQQSVKFVQLSVVYAIISMGLSILLIILFKENKYIGRIYGYIIAIIINSSVSLYFLFKLSNFKFEKKHLIYALSFSIPFLPHLASQLILSVSDRIIINQLTGAANTGLYSFAYNIATIMLAVTGALMAAFVPVFYDYLNKNDYESIKNKVKPMTNFVFFVALFLILFAKEIIMLMADEKYYEALNILPWIIIGYVFFYFYMIYSVYATYDKKTGVFSLITLSVGVINVLLNYLLIPRFGYKVAAITTFISYVLLFLFHFGYAKYILKKRVIPLSLNLRSFFIFLFSIPFGLWITSFFQNQIINIIFKILFLTLVGVFLLRGQIIKYLKSQQELQ